VPQGYDVTVGRGWPPCLAATPHSWGRGSGKRGKTKGERGARAEKRREEGAVKSEKEIWRESGAGRLEMVRHLPQLNSKHG
jgi:hypothetical protein